MAAGVEKPELWAWMQFLCPRPSNEVPHVEPGYLTPATRGGTLGGGYLDDGRWGGLPTLLIRSLFAAETPGVGRNRGRATTKAALPCLILPPLPTLHAHLLPAHIPFSPLTPLQNPSLLPHVVPFRLVCLSLSVTHIPSWRAPSFNPFGLDVRTRSFRL
jgi:hypothetical protein